MDKKKNFVFTKDKETAVKLKVAGFTFLGDENGLYKFVNDANKLLTFEKEKVVYTNILNV